MMAKESSMETLDGKRIVVTGGATGIGLATARLAVERGASVVLVSRNEERLRAAAGSLGTSASHHVLDVGDAEAVEQAFAAIGPIDHLVTCASGTIAGPFAELAEDEVRSFFEIKFWGQYRAAKAALPHLAPDGSIVLMSGFLYRKPQRDLSPFAAADGAIEGLVKALALEVAPIRVNALAAGHIDSLGGGEPMEDEARRAYHESVAAEVPLGRIGTTEEAAHAALFLAENTYLTGVTLDVDGGKR
jgi:NAD(P)-dependent dehydrogenase (short-subunit alcohol dehydrogenase family)